MHALSFASFSICIVILDERMVDDSIVKGGEELVKNVW